MPIAAPKQAGTAPRQVGFLVFDGYQPLDIAGPWQALCTANEELGRPAYQPVVTSFVEAPRTVDQGLRLQVERLIPAHPGVAYDMVVVPGGEGVHTVRRDPRVIEWLRDRARQAERTCSVCTGAFLLAHAGLLNGRTATTHWRSAARLQAECPAVTVDADRIYCESGAFWTSAGVTAGIDLALALIERDLGHELAQRVARRLVVYLRRSGGQLQYSEPLSMQERASAPFMALLERLEADLAARWSVDDMAQASNMSRRTFQRKFREHFQMTPSELLARLRSERLASFPGRPLKAKEVERYVGGRAARPPR